MFRKLFLLVCAAAVLVSCGTDTKPSYFTNIVRSDADIDALTACLTETPQVDGDTLTIKSNIPCLTELSNSDPVNLVDLNEILSVSDILVDPEYYMDRLITVDGVVKKFHYNQNTELFTNSPKYRFIINTHGAGLYILDADGEEVPLEIGELYRFRCRITQLKKHVDHGGRWEIDAEFIVSEHKKIIYPPEKVEDPPEEVEE